MRARTILIGVLLMSACVADERVTEVGAPATAPSDPSEILRQFSGCPQLSDVEASDFANRWSALTSAEGTCASCHAPSQPGIANGFIAIDPDPEVATGQVTGTLERLSVFFTVQGGDVVVNEAHLRAAEAGERAHATYDLDTTGAWPALLSLYGEARARLAADACDEPQF